MPSLNLAYSTDNWGEFTYNYTDLEHSFRRGSNEDNNNPFADQNIRFVSFEDFDYENEAHELRWVSNPKSRVRWVLGAFKEDNFTHVNVRVIGRFGDVFFVGGDLEGTAPGDVAGLDVEEYGSEDPASRDPSNDVTIGKLNVAYQPGDDLLVFAQWSEGFRLVELGVNEIEDPACLTGGSDEIPGLNGQNLNPVNLADPTGAQNGTRMPGTPRTQLSVTTDYTWPGLVGGFDGNLNVNYVYTDAVNNNQNESNVPGLRGSLIEGDGISLLNLGFTLEKESLSFDFYVNNVFDSIQSAFSTINRTETRLQYNIARPRVIGVGVRKEF